VDRGEFVDELRRKLPAFIRERIAAWQKKYAEKQAAFSERQTKMPIGSKSYYQGFFLIASAGGAKKARPFLPQSAPF
jgi:hypothetical protein